LTFKNILRLGVGENTPMVTPFSRLPYANIPLKIVRANVMLRLSNGVPAPVNRILVRIMKFYEAFIAFPCSQVFNERYNNEYIP